MFVLQAGRRIFVVLGSAIVIGCSGLSGAIDEVQKKKDADLLGK